MLRIGYDRFVVCHNLFIYHLRIMNIIYYLVVVQVGIVMSIKILR